MLQVSVNRRQLLIFATVIALFVSVAWIGAANQARAGSATPVVYVTTGENFPDALGAGPAAAIVKGPILLVAQNAIPGETAAELTRLAPDKIIIVGGTAVVSPAVEDGLKAYAGTVERIAGSNRYDTAAKLSASVFPASVAAFPGPIDADTLDGKDSAAFASSVHDHDANYLAISGKAADAGLLDGMDSTEFLGTADKAADSEKLDGKDSTAFVEHGQIEMTTSGNAWMGLEGNPATRFAAATAFSGAGAAVISLPGPGAIGGIEYGLSTFDLCVIGFGGGYVTGVTVVAINSFGPGVADDQYITIPSYATDRTTGCYTYVVDSSVGQGVGLLVNLAGGGSVELWAVRSLWTPGAAGA
jgi:hypothetical protein